MRRFELLSRAVAAARARESERPDRLLDDPLAAVLAGDEGRAFLERLEALLPPDPDPRRLNPLGVRTRFFDDFLVAAAPELAPAPQVVVLAAGMDARAFRLDWPAGTHLFELDFPGSLSLKQSLLDGAAPRCRRIPVGADLAGPWANALTDAGFHAGSPSLWLAEGLLTYFDEPLLHRTLHTMSALAAPGSRLGVDLCGKHTLALPALAPLRRLLDDHGTPWRFGTDAPETFLALYGWQAAVTQTGDAGFRYGRGTARMPPRNLQGLPRDFLVTARRRGKTK